MSKLGVAVHQGYNLHEIAVDEETRICQGITFRKKADDYESILEEIEQKKAAIVERDANSENNDKGFDDNKSEEDGENMPITLE